MKMMLRHATAAVMPTARGGCTAFDPLDQRGETIDLDAADYANNAEIMNVIPAGLFEPLTFVTITGFAGADSAIGALGQPRIALGPYGTSTSPRDFVIDPNFSGAASWMSASRQLRNHHTFDALIAVR